MQIEWIRRIFDISSDSNFDFRRRLSFFQSNRKDIAITKLIRESCCQICEGFFIMS